MIGPRDYETLRELLLANSGHHLEPGKDYLIAQRLGPLLISLGFPDLSTLIRHLRLTGDPRVMKQMCEAMTTNESLFFRDGRPFDLLRDRIFPDLVERRRSSRRLRLWSAACSTGQEAYSMAMLVAEYPGLEGWSVEILGTDYSRRVLERAREGVFNQFETKRGLPGFLLRKYFDPVDDNAWRAKASLRSKVTFREWNLLAPYDALGTFDVVFCRNVLIYFDAQGKRAVLERMAGAVRPDGYLFLGASETALGVSAHWRVVPGAGTTLFQRELGAS